MVDIYTGRDVAVANNIIDTLNHTSQNVGNFYLPSYSKDKLLPFMYNNSNNYQCRGFGKDFITFAFLDNSADNFITLNFIKLYNSGDFENYFVHSWGLDSTTRSNLVSYLNNFCTFVFYDGNFHEYNNTSFNTNNYDDLVHSQNPSEYIISMLYIFIPVLLFIIGLKVFKKGLFK